MSQARKRKISLNSLPLEDIIADTLSQTDQREDMLTRMERAVKSLPERDATLLRLYYYEDKSVEQCAGIMDMSIPNVKVRLHRIRTALKKILER